MTTTEVKRIALECLEAWTSGDFDRTRGTLADDVTFEGPLGSTIGADEYVQGVRGMAELVKGADIHAVIGEGDEVSVSYDLVTTTAGRIPTVGWYRLRDGKIRAVRAYFDPRPLVSPA